MNVWSISTTVRNPERIPNFCRAIKAVTGKKWDKSTQLEFSYELIRLKFYRPNHMTDSQMKKFDDPGYLLSLSEAREIFDTQMYKDPPMRGRTAIAPLRDIGVVRLTGKVELTSIGKKLVSGDLSLQDVLLNYGLKWEVPTPKHKVFSEQNGFNIRPFIGSLALISRVNDLWKESGFEPVGLSREEFEIFAPTLISHEFIDKYAARIIEIRKLSRSKKTAAEKLAAVENGYAKHLSGCSAAGKVTQTDRKNLRDFGDNAIRYFRQTGFIEYRGAGRYVDIATAAVPQTAMLIAERLYKPVGFEDRITYFDYVADLDSFTPPWADKRHLVVVKKHLRNILKDSGLDVEVDVAKSGEIVNKVRGEDNEIVELRKVLVDARLKQMKAVSRQSSFLDELILEYNQLIGRSYEGHLPKPLALEFNTFKTFLSLNDAIFVKANYPTGDDGEPTSTAPGGATDLICEYKDFVLSVEVTLSGGNTQWVMEGQPVQRHLRSIEAEYSKPAYALFLAPKLHADTVETFWIANMHGYQGNKQRIIALEMSTWCDYLGSKKERLTRDQYRCSDLKLFLDAALPKSAVHSNSVQWKQNVNSTEFVMSFS